MEFCCKFNGSMKFQIILFGLLSLLVLNGESACNYYQVLEPGQIYYVYNPEFPDAYRGENHCTWETQSSYNTIVNCTVRMGNYCNKENLSIKFANGAIYNFCGYNNIIIDGINPFIKFDSTYDSQGGTFLCEIQTYADNNNNNNNCQCGWKKVTKIVGGTETGVNEFPMMAGLVDFMNEVILCGATIISDQYILTAAHCMNGRKINETGIVVGEHDVRTGSETGATKMFGLSGFILHPWYNGGEAENDVAICKIIGTIRFSPEVGPACLPFKHYRDSFENNMATALGWGTLQFAGKQSDTLQKADLNVIPLKKCQNIYSTATDSNICTYTPGKDTCQMDSGGPLLWQDPRTHNLVLIGITSMGSGCAAEDPSISMRVGAFMDWILYATPDAQYCQVE